MGSLVKGYLGKREFWLLHYKSKLCVFNDALARWNIRIFVNSFCLAYYGMTCESIQNMELSAAAERSFQNYVLVMCILPWTKSGLKLINERWLRWKKKLVREETIIDWWFSEQLFHPMCVDFKDLLDKRVHSPTTFHNLCIRYWMKKHRDDERSGLNIRIAKIVIFSYFWSTFEQILVDDDSRYMHYMIQFETWGTHRAEEGGFAKASCSFLPSQNGQIF